MTSGSTRALRTHPPAFPGMALAPTSRPGESADACDKDRELLILVQVGPPTTTAPTAAATAATPTTRP
jgi:hypothetical protein